MPTVRELVKAAQREIRAGDLTPVMASDLLVKLTSLLSSVLEEIREADMAYAIVLLRHLEVETAANRAKVKSEVTPEFQRKREARDTQVVLVELIRSLRQVLRTQSEEMRLQR
jgi:hypothetical protein